MKFTFKGLTGDRIVVIAENEQEARAKAMTERWGEAPQALSRPGPTGEHTLLGEDGWKGLGLDLISVEDTE